MSRPVLITAGATRNPLDSIRYLSAASSGRTGIAIAEALAPGQEVTLLGSAEVCLRAPTHLRTEEYTSTRDLLRRMEERIRAAPRAVVVHACAVGDYEAIPQEGPPTKIPSGQAELVLRLRPTPKIVDQLRRFSEDIRLVSFKAAAPETTDDQLLEIAARQRDRTQSDRVFANVIGRLQQRILLLGDEARWFEHRADAVQALIDDIQAWK